MNNVVRVDVRRTRSTISWREIFEKLNTRTRGRTHSGNVQMRSENLIQMFLFSPEIFAFTCFTKPEQVSIKF